ncbi:hypothetical protein OIDMADRAFT_174120 [Oidiodendron maius Zn]|uniref:Heterokaryon incompatibility domain-containing protein n=1 Tax=Oidiodendron maius (strain Zn) TaxID=913774 RepID=A0A0C3HY19_OIDMZ|nr:hypothetical protein OIDMADRAFT_174120 [Oidiodendron maius Zn]
MADTRKRDLIVSYDIGFHQATRNAEFELRGFSIDDIKRILNCLEPLKKTLGSREPCGPVFNRHQDIPLWQSSFIWSFLLLGAASLLPFQLGAGVILLCKGHISAVRKELPVPTSLLFGWYRNLLTYVKAPLPMVRESIQRKAALCVNRKGRFCVKEDGYAIMSHVWGETMGWQALTAWGPVDISVRRRGISREHFLRFFDRCESEWLWVDVIAMPEVLEDMSSTEQDEIAELRVGVINTLNSIYTKANKVVVIDSLLLRLSSRSPVDVGAILCLGAWMSRLWTYTEARLAKKVILKTKDSSFNLDQVIEFFGRAVRNDTDRYYGLVQRLWPLRQQSTAGLSFAPSTLESAFRGGENRFTDVEVDSVRVLFPLLNLEWQRGWTVQQGLKRLVEKFPGEAEWIQRWCSYRSLEYPAS